MNAFYSQCSNQTDAMIKNSSATLREWGSLIRAKYDADNLHLSRYDGDNRFDGFVRGVEGINVSINGLQDTIVTLGQSVQFLREEIRDVRQENSLLRTEIQTMRENAGYTHVDPSILQATVNQPN